MFLLRAAHSDVPPCHTVPSSFSAVHIQSTGFNYNIKAGYCLNRTSPLWVSTHLERKRRAAPLTEPFLLWVTNIKKTHAMALNQNLPSLWENTRAVLPLSSHCSAQSVPAPANFSSSCILSLSPESSAPNKLFTASGAFPLSISGVPLCLSPVSCRLTQVFTLRANELLFPLFCCLGFQSAAVISAACLLTQQVCQLFPLFQ